MEVNSTGPIGNVGDIPGIARGLHVLVVDHDTASLMSIASELEKHSYKVSTTELASVALSMIGERKGQYDLVVADLNMPEMDAFVFLSKIQLQSNVPIIMMSMDATMEIAKGAINKGACFFLTKPIRSRDIVNLWQHVFRKRNFNGKKNSTGDKIIDLEKIDNNIPSSNSEENSARDIEPKRIISEKMVSTENGKQRELKRRLENKEENGIRSKRVEVKTKPVRINWSDELHGKFLEAIHKLRAQNLEPHPKAVLNMMNVPNLTHRHVASHMQKYKMRQRLFESLRTSLPPALMRTKIPLYHNYLQSKNAANTAVKVSTPQIPIMARPLARPRRWLNVPGNFSTNKTPNYNLISNHGGVEGLHLHQAAANNNGNPNAKGNQTDLGLLAGINFGHVASSSLADSPMTAASSQYCSSRWLTNLLLQTPYKKPAAPGLVVGENCNGIVNNSANAGVKDNIVEEGTANQQVEAATAIGVDGDDDDIDIDYLMQQLEVEGLDFGGFLDDQEDNLLLPPGDTDQQE